MKNQMLKKERFFILTTASYFSPVAKDMERIVWKSSFGGKSFELEGNEECEISFELIVETYLDRIKQYQVLTYSLLTVDH